MYDPDYSGMTEQEHYELLAEEAMCDTPEWFDADLEPVYANEDDARAALECA